jgi:membrane peptidoglycan carboxypeptidase
LQADMQTSLARRQRQRRLGAARRPRGGGAARGALIAIPLVLFGTLLLAGMLALLTVVTAYAHYSEGLPDPTAQLANLQFDQQTIIYDKTGKIELARLGNLRRELVTYDEIPPEVIDATTATEDKTFWDNAGFDPVGIMSAGIDSLQGRERGASTITQQLVRARLLPKNAFAGTRYDRKIREIIQSIRLTQAYPGEDGKKKILTIYLNQNFYGNQSYGVKAAAERYFNKPLSKLTLAEAAVLAAIPQSPTKFDLRKNAISECTVKGKDPDHCPADKLHLVVPLDSEIGIRRNYVLNQMKQFAVLTRGKYTDADYEKAQTQPIVLAEQRSTPWKAPQFVWQVREQLASILCPGDTADQCEAVDTGGFRVTTTLDYKMQKTTEKWVYAASRVPNLDSPRAALRALKIPSSQWSWILDLRGHRINNAASAVVDYRTGEILAYVGSGSYTAKGNRRFQPQFDVLAAGWRQPGSAIKPVNYAIGINDERMTAATMLMDVVTDFGGRFTPSQADHYERGPVSVREALQFSLNIPSIKTGLINGLNHFFDKSKDFGLHYTNTAVPVTSMGIGTLEVHPIDLLGAYGTIANGGVRMPRTMIRSIISPSGEKVYPDGAKPKGKRVISAPAAYVVTDILAGNTDVKVNPYWGKWAIRDGSRRRPAAYKTGTTNDNRDVAAYGYLPQPKSTKQPALAVGVWMGNSDNSPNDGKLSLQTSAPLWSAILSEVSRGMPMARFSASKPKGLVTARVDATSGLLPGPFTTKTVQELFIEGTVPKQRDNLRVAVAIDAATGDLWADGCAGPKVTRGYLDFNRAERNFGFDRWLRYDRGWAARAARGAGVRGGPEGTRTMYFYDRSFHPYGANWGGKFKPSRTCTPPPVETPPPSPCDPFLGIVCPSPTPTEPPGPPDPSKKPH